MTTIHHNAPVRNCRNCAHRKGWDECILKGICCGTAREYGYCQMDRDWRPRPPRRSLLRFLIDTLFRL